MAVELSIQALNSLRSESFTPKIVIEIEGYPILCSGKALNLDERKKGLNTPDFYNLIDFQNSQREISQQLQLEKGGSSSTATYRFRLVDKNSIFTKLFSYVTANQEILEREARVYFGFEGGLFPSDFSPFINGTVGNIDFGPGWCEIAVNHPDKIKKQEVFLPASAVLVTAIDNSTTSLTLDTTEGFLEPALDFRTFVRIEDEIIEYTGLTETSLTGVSRAAFDTVASSHDAESEIETFYEISGNTFEIALRIMLSESGETNPVTVKSINNDGVNDIQNAIYFDDFDIRETIGASIGDIISVTSTSNPLNSFIERKITGYGTSEDRSYYVIDGSDLTQEISPDAVAVFKSQYDVWPSGCGLKMHQVDLQQFESTEALFGPRLLPFNFYLKSEFNADTFINEKLYLPSTFYHLPRKGKNSIGVFNPPLTDLDTVRVNESVVTKSNAPKLVVKRAVGKNFFNYIQYKFNEDTIEDKTLASFINFSAESTQRIPAKNKGIKVETGGLRRTVSNLASLSTNSSRILERYQFGAEEIKVEVVYKEGLKIEIGDPVIFGSDFLQISDSSRGDRNFQPRIMQVTNRSINFSTGQVRLTLLDTSYSIYARYGIISPASKVIGVSGRNIETVPFCDSVTDSEFDTWEPFKNTRVLIRLPDYSYSEEIEIQDVAADGTLFFKSAPNLPSFPVDNDLEGDLNRLYTLSDLIIEPAPYPDNANSSDQAQWKDVYAFFNPRLVITNVIDESNFEVNSTDLSAIIERSFIVAHSPDFTDLSQEVTVSAINSNTITTGTPLSYLPSVGDEIDLVGFIDGGYPYRYF